MDKQKFIQHIQVPNNLSPEITSEFEKITENYPYFQIAKATYLKGLKQNGNYKYDKTLKETAALTTDRTILFEYINKIPDYQQNYEPEKDKNTITKNNKINSTEESLKTIKPLNFDNNEEHSFNEWLQLVKTEPLPKNKKTDIIDRFIEENPSVEPVEKNKKTPKLPKTVFDDNLMTETLARVYLEQKKYKSAIKAYQILILKYPKKSAFFANQIEKIELLKMNK